MKFIAETPIETYIGHSGLLVLTDLVDLSRSGEVLVQKGCFQDPKFGLSTDVAFANRTSSRALEPDIYSVHFFSSPSEREGIATARKLLDMEHMRFLIKLPGQPTHVLYQYHSLKESEHPELGRLAYFKLSEIQSDMGGAFDNKLLNSLAKYVPKGKKR